MNLNQLIDDLPVHHTHDKRYGYWITRVTPNLRHHEATRRLTAANAYGCGRTFTESQRNFYSRARAILAS